MRLFVGLVALVFLVACAGESLGPGAPLPPQTALDTLVALDGGTLPCCTASESGGTVTIVGGSLVYYYPRNDPDTVETPEGPLPAACVIGVPNGIAIGDGYAVLPDSTEVPAPPCFEGEYRLILTRRHVSPVGDSKIDHITVSSGTYRWATDSTWAHDTLTLTDSATGALSTTVAGLTISVVLSGREYTLRVVPGNY